MYIMQKGGPKDAFRVSNNIDGSLDVSTMPDFLKNSVETDEKGNLVLHTLEGQETISNYIMSQQGEYGAVIAWEKADPKKVDTSNLVADENGNFWNVWWKRNAKETLEEINGKFYPISTGSPKDAVREAAIVTDTLPDFIQGVEGVTRVDDGTKKGWEYHIPDSPNPLFAPDGSVWVKHGEGDFNCVQMGTPSADAYVVCTKDGEIKGSLSAYVKNPAEFEQEKSSLER